MAYVHFRNHDPFQNYDQWKTGSPPEWDEPDPDEDGEQGELFEQGWVITQWDDEDPDDDWDPAWEDDQTDTWDYNEDD